jgi:hypothetical protein
VLAKAIPAGPAPTTPMFNLRSAGIESGTMNISVS